ncbi:hypothetical protein [Micromonospora siamensis]|uniref:Uncharacterized protein n=1 Tax=Micromonospora siamensis TaxID=299152 RepID=A0A1C5GKX3_9ACTN|nr:hypothetical protein [Micromonospora siamensis]SCG34227.1 hypothetical protein GA0074704_0024 [Micromonospora siamensis]
MSRKLPYVIGACCLMVVLCCGWAGVGHFLFPPVSSSSLCGTWKASAGSNINIQSSGTFDARDVPFGDSARSGSGGWEFAQGASLEGVLMLRFREDRTSLEVRTRRSLNGKLSLRAATDTEDEYIEYRKITGC